MPHTHIKSREFHRPLFSYETICRMGLFFTACALIVACVLMWSNWLYGVLLFVLTLGSMIFILKKRAFCLPRKPKNRPRVLMLHSVSNEVPKDVFPNNAIRPSELEALICNLKRSGYTFSTLKEAFSTPRPHCIVLTFDDGLVDNYTNLFPILKKWDIKATIFVTDRRGPAFLSDEQIKEMYASGLIEFGGHTIDHVCVKHASQEAREEQIETNLKTIAQLTGEAPVSFAYPFGAYNQAARDYCEKVGIRFAVTTRKKRFSDDLLQIERQIIPRDMPPFAAYLLVTRGKAWI